MRFDTIIKNGTIITATDTTLADVGISDGKISAGHFVQDQLAG